VRTVGVTGTNGKTTTTTLVAATLARLARPVARVTTVGFHLDDESVTDLPASHAGFIELMRRAEKRGGRWAAVEYTSEALAHGYSRKWPAEIAVFTNLTHDHLDAHGSPEHYLASKAQLFMSLPEGGTAVMNAADESSALIEEVIPKGRKILRYSVPSRGVAEADMRATEVELSWSGTHVTLISSIAGVPEKISVRAIGEVFAENALGALGAAIAAGVPPSEAAEALAAAAPPPGRFQVVSERPWVVIDYAHSPDALKRTLASARRLCTGALHVVFGAGGNRDKDKRGPMGEAASIADRIVLTTDNARGEDPAVIAAAIRAGITAGRSVETILDRGEAIARAIHEARPDDVVVIAGKGHERTQTVAGKVVPFDDTTAATEAFRTRT
jgi:UDP-N-acetylmuramoyl-L-alanyl-D-glutamate--2,6-diaminopimelate ligase